MLIDQRYIICIYIYQALVLLEQSNFVMKRRLKNGDGVRIMFCYIQSLTKIYLF